MFFIISSLKEIWKEVKNKFQFQNNKSKNLNFDIHIKFYFNLFLLYNI